MDTVYTIVQIFCLIGIIISNLIFSSLEHLNSYLYILCTIHLILVILNDYIYLKLMASSSIILIGTVIVGKYFILDLTIIKYLIVPSLGIMLDFMNTDKELDNKWLYPIRMFEYRFWTIVMLYLLNLVIFIYGYFDLKYTFMDHTLFALILSIFMIKIIFLIYGRYAKTEIIDNEIIFCFKKRQYPRVQFGDEQVIYIGTALNSPIIKEFFDIAFLCLIGFFYGSGNMKTNNFILLFIFSVIKIVVGKNSV